MTTLLRALWRSLGKKDGMRVQRAVIMVSPAPAACPRESRSPHLCARHLTKPDPKCDYCWLYC